MLSLLTPETFAASVTSDTTDMLALMRATDPAQIDNNRAITALKNRLREHLTLLAPALRTEAVRIVLDILPVEFVRFASFLGAFRDDVLRYGAMSMAMPA